jgi:hypothetical protein
VKVAFNVTALLGILKVHEALEQETPDIVDQLEKDQSVEGDAVTVTD